MRPALWLKWAKSLPVTRASPIRTVPAILPPIQLPVTMPGEAATTRVGDTDGAPGSWLQPGLALVVAGVLLLLRTAGEGRARIVERRLLRLSLSLTLCLSNKLKINLKNDS